MAVSSFVPSLLSDLNLIVIILEPCFKSLTMIIPPYSFLPSLSFSILSCDGITLDLDECVSNNVVQTAGKYSAALAGSHLLSQQQSHNQCC